MDAQRHALLDALDRNHKTAYQEALSAWSLTDKSTPRPVYRSLKWALINAATKHAVTVNDVVRAVLGRGLRPTLRVTAKELASELTDAECEAMAALRGDWPRESVAAPVVNEVEVDGSAP